jgi:hypothetical protein
MLNVWAIAAASSTNANTVNANEHRAQISEQNRYAMASRLPPPIKKARVRTLRARWPGSYRQRPERSKRFGKLTSIRWNRRIAYPGGCLMCRARLVSLLVLFIAPGFTAPVQAGVEDEIKKLSAAYDKAIQTKNQKSLEMFLAEDGHFVDYDGSLHTKQQHVASYLDRKFKWESVKSIDRRIRVLSDTAATETGTFDATGTMDGQPFHMRDRYIDVWSKVDGRWVVVAEFATRIVEKRQNHLEALDPKQGEIPRN